ncbi:MAG: UvrD-helicase domain-containing protein [Methanothermobacter tenebrarum]
MLSDEFYRQDRNRYLENILNSDCDKKLIIAGPGTGKTYTFKKLLEKSFEKSKKKALVITFIRNLVKDLDKELSGYAEVRTFHSFCRSEIKKIKGKNFEYYPNLLSLIKSDFNILYPSLGIKEKSLDDYFYDLKREIINQIVDIADYYNAGGHNDSVYRVYDYFGKNPEKIPTYPIILVDEYQDFNLLETKIVEKLADKNPVLIVGDDDQALYKNRKSSPKYIRQLASNTAYQKFELPYCSRCPQVIVDAVNNIIEISRRNGYLKGRINKPFKYFPPDKFKDSKENPKIMQVFCSVERKKCNYAAKYILNEIINMPDEYKEEALQHNEPAVLVIGSKQFLNGVKSFFQDNCNYLNSKGWTVEERKDKNAEIHILDGFKFLMSNFRSRLGWRIILERNKDISVTEILKKAIMDNIDFVDLIDDDLIKSCCETLGILKKIINQEKLKEAEKELIINQIKLSVDDIKKYFDNRSTDEEMESPENQRILCTSFEGSKGLAAQYVFILGFNEGHFPKTNPPSDLDICRLIVALTRTRKRAYIVSYGRLGKDPLKESIFVSYIKEFLSSEIKIDKDYIKNLPT